MMIHPHDENAKERKDESQKSRPLIFDIHQNVTPVFIVSFSGT